MTVLMSTAWPISYWEATDPAATTPLLLLHGFNGLGAGWAEVVDGLGPHGPILAPDLPGHGTCPAPAADADLDAAADALAAQLGGPCDVVGYSLGGRLALHLATRYPALVSRLILVGASPGLKDAEERTARVKSDETWATRIVDDGLSAFATAWEAQPLFAGLARLPVERRAGLDRMRRAHSPEALAAAMRAFSPGRQRPLHDVLPYVVTPTWWVAGALDLRYVAIAREMAGVMPHSRFLTVPGAGHAVPLEAPDLLSTLIRDVLAPIPRRTL